MRSAIPEFGLLAADPRRAGHARCRARYDLGRDALDITEHQSQQRSEQLLHELTTILESIEHRHRLTCGANLLVRCNQRFELAARPIAGRGR